MMGPLTNKEVEAMQVYVDEGSANRAMAKIGIQRNPFYLRIQSAGRKLGVAKDKGAVSIIAEAMRRGIVH